MRNCARVTLHIVNSREKRGAELFNLRCGRIPKGVDCSGGFAATSREPVQIASHHKMVRLLSAMNFRPLIDVRQATATDAEALVALWDVVRAEHVERENELTPTSASVACPTVEEAARVLAFNENRHGRHVLVASVDGQVVGVVGADVATFSIISEPRVLLITDFLVNPEYRRRSVGAALLRAVAGLAEEEGCDVVTATLPPWAKEPNRYLTKFGFNQVAVLRAVPLARLHAKLAARASGSKQTGRLVARRRTLRRRVSTVVEDSN